MGDLGTYEGTYVGMIDHNVTLVARGLDGIAPALGSQRKVVAIRSIGIEKKICRVITFMNEPEAAPILRNR